jgi:transcriptional regulator with XRE-family HTH domain
MTLEELGDLSGLHRTFISLIERGERGLSLDTAFSLADALDAPLSQIIETAERGHSDLVGSGAARRRVVADDAIMDDRPLRNLTGLTGDGLRKAVEYMYDTFDIIDAQLAARGLQPISGLVEPAKLSSMVGNLLGAGLANFSHGLYQRNRPHAFPDLVPQRLGLPDLELKTALETNYPKGHLPKEGVYITFRYVLGGVDGTYVRGDRSSTVWVWEVRIGHLTEQDFSISNTAGDSGKTAVIRTNSLKAMSLVMQDERFYPYVRRWA